MHGRRVERVVAVDDAQEAGRLLERAIADARHLQELLASPERPVLVAERDDVLRDRRRSARRCARAAAPTPC